MESGGPIRWVRMRLVSGLHYPVSRTSRSTCRLPTLAGLGVSPDSFRAESKTVLGKAQASRVEASQEFYCPGFIQPNKQTNKQTLKWMSRGQYPLVFQWAGRHLISIKKILVRLVGKSWARSPEC